jgi:hypothetical protein
LDAEDQGEASLEAGAGTFLKKGEKRDHCVRREIMSHPYSSLIFKIMPV